MEYGEPIVLSGIHKKDIFDSDPLSSLRPTILQLFEFSLIPLPSAISMTPLFPEAFPFLVSRGIHSLRFTKWQQGKTFLLSHAGAYPHPQIISGRSLSPSMLLEAFMIYKMARLNITRLSFINILSIFKLCFLWFLCCLLQTFPEH